MKKVIHSFIHLGIAILLFSCARQTYTLKPSALENEIVNSEMGRDSIIESIILPYRQPLEASMNEVLIECDATASKGLPESSMGNLVADMLREGASRLANKNMDVAFLNTGGLRVEWPKGKITRAMVFELMPFENMVEYVVMDGKAIQLLMDQVAARGGSPVSGITFNIDKGKAINIAIAEKPLDMNRKYTLVSSDYLLNNGDKYEIPSYIERVSLKMKFRDLLLDEIQLRNTQNRTLSPKTDGRVKTIDTP
jgi:2',3'-cyclic-nucleotide 2'-phosphodiesterase (5'-nucleotidase family)